MGSGKSAVGRRLAELLGWRFLDMDAEVERAAGRSVPEIFERSGEARFRELEEAAGRRLLGENRAVVAAGGGWACAPGRLDALPGGTLSIWLRVSADAALARVGDAPAARPLLDVDDPSATARRLLRDREPFYVKARWTLDTEGRTPEEVARTVRERLGSAPAAE